MLAEVPAGAIRECKTLSELQQLANDPTGPICGWTRVPNAPTYSLAQLDAEHLDSMRHMLRTPLPKTVPGGSGTMRNATRLAVRALAPLLDHDLFTFDSIHINRAWCQKNRRHFQGRQVRETPEPSPFRMLKPDEIPGDAAVYQLPLVGPSDHPILFVYASAPNGMCYPHGIAKGGTRKPTEWHTEPGGHVYIYVTLNTPTASAGFYVNPDAESLGSNYTKRLDASRRGVYKGIHDDGLLEWLRENQVPVTIANYICAASNALPVTWGGHMVSDPLTMKGQGCVANKQKVTGPFVLKQGDAVLDDVKWPTGIRPPPILVEWARERKFRFVDTFLDIAEAHPRAFLKFFPDFEAEPKPTAAAPAAAAEARPKKRLRLDK